MLLNKSSVAGFTEEDIKKSESLTDVVSPFIYKIEKINEFFNKNLTENELLNKYSKFGLIGKSNAFIDLLKSN